MKDKQLLNIKHKLQTSWWSVKELDSEESRIVKHEITFSPKDSIKHLLSFTMSTSNNQPINTDGGSGPVVG